MEREREGEREREREGEREERGKGEEREREREREREGFSKSLSMIAHATLPVGRKHWIIIITHHSSVSIKHLFPCMDMAHVTGR